MAHFARILDGVVQNVIVIANEQMLDQDGLESEQIGKQYCAKIFDTSPDVWIQCSYNASVNGFRGCYPGQAFTWDGSKFIPPISESP